MKKKTNISQVSLAQFFFQWGDEPSGYVSFGFYDSSEVYHFIGYGPREWVKPLRLKFHNPYP